MPSQTLCPWQSLYEEMYARDYQEAREVALARNPNAQVVSVTAVF